MTNTGTVTGANGKITFEFVWGNVSPGLIEEVITFWVTEKALPKNENAHTRASQLLMTARNGNGELVAVSTAERKRIPELLNNVFYYFRVFVSSSQRNKGLQAALSHRAREIMQKRFLSGEDTLTKGFYLAIESPILKKVHSQAAMIFGGIDHPFIGVDKYGNHLRVGWFDGANID